jgi:hypothetical protein
LAGAGNKLSLVMIFMWFSLLADCTASHHSGSIEFLHRRYSLAEALAT